MTERLVKQRLAIAGLYTPILNAYRRGKIDPRSIRHLTMASVKQQKAWFKLFRDDQEPPAWKLKSWLFGGEAIPTSNALFDVDSYTGVITTDLFGKNSYFVDPALFWELQSKAIAEIKSDLEEDGWPEVIVLDVGESWSKWDHAEVPKDKGGRVYIQALADGEVLIHKGLLPEKEAKRLAQVAAGETPEKTDRPELTQAMQNYLDLHRHAAVRAALLSHHSVALRLAVAQMIAGSDLWTVRADPQRCANEAIGQSIQTNTGEIAFDAQRSALREMLGIGDDADDTLVYRKDDWGKSHDLFTVFVKLLSLSDEEVMDILTFVAAETLPAGSDMVEMLGVRLNIDMRQHWQVDEAFLDLLRDKEAINAMLSDVAGKDVAAGNIAATAKAQKGIIRDCITGENTRSANPDWHPRYMRFPMQGYTKRQNTIPAVKAGAAIQKVLTP